MMSTAMTNIVVFISCAFAIVSAINDACPADGDSSDCTAPPNDKPNVIIFYADDMGWGDLSSYGHPSQEWGRVDDMALQGMRFTNFYAPSTICTPSRAGLLTGRQPSRVGIRGLFPVFLQSSTNGLPKEEITIAEALKDQGYNTGLIGKWHLGMNAHNHTDGTHLPHHHGFDFVGHNLPLSNAWECDEEQVHTSKHCTHPAPAMCFLYKNNTICQQPLSHYDLTEDLTNDAIRFMRESHQEGKPFFLYYGIVQPHSSMYSSDKFRGKSIRGVYGDQINELAWSVGSILDEVKRLNEDTNTLSIFSSDNGPQVGLCIEGGDAGALKGGKGNYYEGGIRIPAIFHWPNNIKPATTSNVVASQLDIFPTIMSIVGGSTPDDRIMDGEDISSALFNWAPEPQPEEVVRRQLYKKPKDHNEPRLLVFFCNDILYTVRYGCYKFHFKTQVVKSKEDYQADPEVCGEGGSPVIQDFSCMFCSAGKPPPNPYLSDMPESCFSEYDPPLMYNLCTDPNEAYPLNASISENKAVLDTMQPKLDTMLDSMTFGPALLSSFSMDVVPCCTPETFPDCRCNYEYKGP